MGGHDVSGAENPEIVVFPGKTQEKRGKTKRGAGGIRTHDGGFAIRPHGPETPGKTALSENTGANAGAVETKTGRDNPDLQAVIDAWQDLPNAVKAGIVAMVQAASGKP